MKLAPFLRDNLTVYVDGRASRDELFLRLSEIAAEAFGGGEPAALADALAAREAQVPTTTPEGVAFPHAIIAELPETLVIPALVTGGVDFGEASHGRSDLIFCMFAPSGDHWLHLRLLARMARLVHTDASREQLRSATSAAEFYEALIREDDSHG